MLEAATRHRADAVRGQHVWLPPVPEPFWFRPPDPPGYADGDRIEHAGGGNVLFAGRLACLSFDERLAHGEDTDFFYHATLAGAHIAYSTRPVTYETVLPHRATLRYQTLRAFYYAASWTHFHRRYKGIDGALVKVLVRLIWQVPISVVRFATTPLVWPFSARVFKRHVLKGLGRLVGAAGAIVGLAGFSGNPYRNLT